MSKNKVLMRLCEDDRYGDLEFLADTADSLESAASQIEAMGHKIVGQGEQVFLFSIIPENKDHLAHRVERLKRYLNATIGAHRRYSQAIKEKDGVGKHYLVVHTKKRDDMDFSEDGNVAASTSTPHENKEDLLAKRVDAAFADRLGNNRFDRIYEKRGGVDKYGVQHIYIIAGPNEAMPPRYQNDILAMSKFGLKVELASQPGYYTYFSITLADE